MLYHRLPYPPNKGDKIRAYQQVAYLSERHRVWLACFVDSQEDRRHFDEVKRMCHRFAVVPLNKHTALSRGGMSVLFGKTLTEGYYGSRALWRVILDWSEQQFFDVAFAFSSSMAVYLEDYPAARRVLDMNDFDSHKWADYARKGTWPMSGVYRTESKRLAVREIELVRNYDLTLMVNPRECERLDDPQLRAKMTTFPTPMQLSNFDSVQGIHHDKIVGYLGTLDYAPNVESVLWFAQHVWRGVLDRHPDAEWWIVGRNPDKEIRKLRKQRGIKVTGEVEDILPYLARMRCFAAPVQTDIGVQTKVLEAMAAGRPVVISELGHGGIGATPGDDYLVASEPTDFVDAIDKLFGDHPLCESLGRRAVDFIRRHHDAGALMPRFERLLSGEPALQEAAS